MRTVAWERRASIALVRRDIWRHITQAARTNDDVLLRAGALLNMPPRDVRVLAQLQFVLSEPVGRLLESMPFLIRRLTTTTVHETEVSAERVRGSIRWSETLSMRAASGVPHVFVTSPARRAFDTPENQLLAFALGAIADFGRRTGWHTSTSPGVGDEIRRRVSEAMRWSQARALVDSDARRLDPKTVARVRAGRHRQRYGTVLEVADLYSRFIARLDRNAIRDAVENHALITSSDPVLLELICGFKMLDTLPRLGWSPASPALLRPPLIYRGTKDDRVLELYYQHGPARLKRRSIYRDVQNAHGFSAGGLIPDFVIRIRRRGDAQKWLLVEVKGVERSVLQSARAAALDLLAYRRAFDDALGRQVGAYGLGVAWGADMQPSSDAEIVLCSPDTLPRALEKLAA